MKYRFLSILVLICISFCLHSCGSEHCSTNSADYETYVDQVLYANEFMPSLESVGNYESLCITQKKPSDYLFKTTNSVVLIVNYSETEYLNAINQILTTYKFLDSKSGGLIDINASVAGYEISVVDDPRFYYGNTVVNIGGSQGFCCNAFLMIGFNEENRNIAYLYHWDDSVSKIDDLDKFIENGYILTQ